MLMIIGCSPTKKVSKQDVTQKQQSNTELQKTDNQKSDLTTSVNTEKKAEATVKKNTSSAENETEETTTHTILYDTKSKVDSVTNRPPVASETIQKTTKGKNKKDVETTETLYSANEVTLLFSNYLYSYTSKIDSLNKVITDMKSEVTSKEIPKPNGWKWLLASMAISLLVWLIYHYKLWKFVSF